MERPNQNLSEKLAGIRGRQRIKLPCVQSLEARRLLSAAWALTVPPISPVGRVQAVNDAAMVAGQNSSGGGFIYSGGKVTNFQAPGNLPVTVTSINASGQVVGYTSNRGIYRAFLYSGGNCTLLTPFGGVWSEAIAINNS